ncbi:MAG: VPLPA-CTERM sorting domain-containing protein [Nitrospira sp. CG24C]|jgi:formylglycine-generating enzyme required for sulfatase activity|nr:MAG: VPLPA-CTERM sorting domain-containing protein [Nitrospira sp. CG24C]
MNPSSWILVAALALAALFQGAVAEASYFNIDTVVVGHAGNSADPLTGLGAVSYEYRISSTEVTNAQYAAFLNTVDPGGVNPHDLYNPDMTNATGFAVVKGGIDFDPGTAPGSMYNPKSNYGDKPVNYVSFYDAARFANWVMTGDTENGFYTFTDTNTLASQGTHGPDQYNGMNWVAIPSHDEWYKAAFHKNDGATGNYYLYPTSSNSAPTIATATPTGIIANPGQNVANYNFGANWDGTGNLGHVTTVGSAGLESVSPYGTFDQGGNVMEWIDAVSGSNRVMRGGSLWLDEETLRSTYSSFYNPNVGGSSLGFRLSSLGPISVVPIPAAAWLFGTGLLGLAALKRRRSGC